jgi:hypothetical protein
MDCADHYDLPGESASVADFKSRKAKELAAYVEGDTAPYVRLIETRQNENVDVVVLEVEPEVPQDPVHDIHVRERIAVLFDHKDESGPEPLALREGFPKETLHQNIVQDDAPRSLCLYNEPYHERRLGWTAGKFLRRLREWLKEAARGDLHGDDQPLERLFLGTLHRIVLPSSVLSEKRDDPSNFLSVASATETRDKWTIVTEEGNPQEERTSPFVGITYTAAPRKHGIVQAQPETLAELDGFLGEEGFVETIREQLKDLKDSEGNRPFKRKLIIVLRVPKTREESAPPESMDVWAFSTVNPISAVGEDVGAWEMKGGEAAILLRPEDENTDWGEETQLVLFNPTPALTRDRAAELSGAEADQSHHVAIGLGTLGSQVQTNLVKMGYGEWTLLDKDVLLPHNVPRHQLGGDFVGRSKSVGTGYLQNASFETPVSQWGVVDVLSEEDMQDIDGIYRDADGILDMSASVAVARHLALDVDSDARRTSLFLSPSGQDLVLLAEPSDRSLRLDQLEMEYYRALLQDDGLEDHLKIEGEPLRYGRSCRDVSSELPQDLAALHSGVGARAYRSLDAEGNVKIWRANEDMTVESVVITPPTPVEFEVGKWTLSISAAVIEKMKAQRKDRLPNETGGVLYGVFDTQRRRIYVVGMVPSPPDSGEWPDAYVRGTEGLEERLEEISTRTGGQLGYVGEWHSHPDDSSAEASDDDQEFFDWLVRHRRKDGLPAVMAIQGESDKTRWYVKKLATTYEVSTPEI